MDEPTYAKYAEVGKFSTMEVQVGRSDRSQRRIIPKCSSNFIQ